MQCVERHIIKRSDPRFAAIDAAAFAAKNLYNAANYLMRQEYIFNNERILSYTTLYHQAKSLPAYQELPRKVSQHVLKTLQKNWKAFRAARQEWEHHPDTFLGRPGLRQGYIVPSGLDISVQTRQPTVQQMRIVPKKTHYIVEVVYERAAEPAKVDPSLIAGVGLGIDNLATIASNKAGFVDGEAICHHERYVGKRVQRGLFRAADRRRVYNADVNGALNIIRKVVPAAFGQGIEGVVVYPVRLAA